MPPTQALLDIHSMDLEARGIASHATHPVLVAGSLPGERVRARTTKRGTHFDKAQLHAIVRPSAQRTTPACTWFGTCGGCNMQHLEPAAQVAVKQRILETLFQTQASLRPAHMLPPIYGTPWGYRDRARLSVRFVPKKGGVLVGFRERNGSYVTDMHTCKILPPHVSALLMPLRMLVASLSQPARIPQIEVAVGTHHTALVLRHVEPLLAGDLQQLRTFAREHQVIWWLQPKGPDTAHPLLPQDRDALTYTLPEYGLCMPFTPTDFTQVNHTINRLLIRYALTLLDPHSTDRVADFFCGLGNFSLPLARFARAVVGIEGNPALIARATQNAQAHNLHHKTQFHVHDLFDIDTDWLHSLGVFQRMLIDPPREGAQALCVALAALPAPARVQRIVYVSCNPVTLARDAAILCHRGAYMLQAAGVINMFPHTGHIESIAVFEAKSGEPPSLCIPAA